MSVGCAVTGEDQLRKLDCAEVERCSTARDSVIKNVSRDIKRQTSITNQDPLTGRARREGRLRCQICQLCAVWPNIRAREVVIHLGRTQKIPPPWKATLPCGGSGCNKLKHAGRKYDWPQETGQTRGKHDCSKHVVDSLNVPLSRILVARTRGDEFPVAASAGKVSNIRLEEIVCVQRTQR